jgi:hypothetical protein
VVESLRIFPFFKSGIRKKDAVAAKKEAKAVAITNPLYLKLKTIIVLP